MTKRIFRLTGIILLVLALVLLLFFLLRPRNHAPQIIDVQAVPQEVISAGRVCLVVKATDPDGDSLSFSAQTTTGAFTQEDGVFWWTAPTVTDTQMAVITLTVKDTHGATASSPETVRVFPKGWKGIVGMTVVETKVPASGEVKLDFKDIVLAGDSIKYTYSATGGTFDTLPNGEIVWRPPAVDKETTFVVTIEAVNEKGERVIKQMVVTVKPQPAPAAPGAPVAAPAADILKDTVVASGAVVNVGTQDMHFEGKDIKYTYSATGGTFDTLADGRIVWRAPEVETTTTYTITVEGVDETGHKIIKKIQVTVAPKGTILEQVAAQRESILAVTRAAQPESAVTETAQAAALVYGTVSTTQGKALSGAIVGWEGRTVQTDQLGNYHFSITPRATQLTITFNTTGYEPAVKDLAFTGDTEYLVSVVLRMEAPGQPRNVAARTVPDSVVLTWESDPTKTLLGYNVYRSTDEFTGFERLNKKPMAIRKYVDIAVQDSVPYFYKVAAVNVDEIETELTDAVEAIVPIKLFAVKAEYPSPFANPTGIEYDGHDIWTCDNLKGQIYKHDWELNVSQKFKSPEASPTGLAWDGSSLWSCDFKSRTICQHGPDMKVVRRIKGPSFNLTDLAWDGKNLWAINSEGQIYCLDANGKTVVKYKSPFSLSTGIAWDGSSLWVTSIHSKKIYQLTRDGNIADVYESPYLLSDGFAFDGKHFWASGKVTEKIYKFSWK
jgi:phosphopantetheine adenylyltransferase